jgi:large subunit ribosomal protein L29
MKPDHLKGMSDDELALTLRDTEKHLFQLRFQSATDRLETPSEIKKAKKDIARIKTIQRERQLGALNKSPDADLTKQLADLEGREDGPGKRRIKRAIQRVQNIQATRAVAAAKGSGK